MKFTKSPSSRPGKTPLAFHQGATQRTPKGGAVVIASPNNFSRQKKSKK